MKHSNHFQLCISLDPPPKVRAVNGKQQTACDCFFEQCEIERHATERHERQTKKLSFVYVCLMNRRLRGGDNAVEDQGVMGDQERGGFRCWISQRPEWEIL